MMNWLSFESCNRMITILFHHRYETLFCGRIGLAWLLFLFWVGSPETQAIEVSGTVASDTVWSVASSPVSVTGSVTVAEGVTLTIEPGVRVEFNQYQGLWIHGQLRAVGTASAPIVFDGTTGNAGWWHGIQVVNAGSATLEWCEVAHGGYWDGVGLLKTGSGALTLKNSILRDHSGDGLRLGAGYSSFISQTNRYSGNARGVRVGLNASFDDKTSTFSGNTMDVYLDGGTLTGPAVWGLRPDYSLFVSQDLSVAPEGSLTIRAGTVVKFAQYAGLYVSGRLEVPGTSAEPVYLTDWRDDTVGGDANRDEGGTKPGPGWWRTLQISGAGSAALAYCTVRYAGYWDRVGMAKSGSGDLTMSHCAVTDMLGHGLQVVNSPGTTLLESSTYANNTRSGMYVNASLVIATNCAFNSNSEGGVLQEANISLDYKSNQFAGNAAASVLVNGGAMTNNVIWKRGGGQEFVMVVQGDLIVEEGAVLAVEPGVKVRFVRYPLLAVKGELKAVGTVLAPIVFEGTTGEVGWWRGIQVVNAGSATLEWCEVAHGGYWDGVGLLKTGSGALTLKNSILRDHSGDGLRLGAGYSSFISQTNRYSGNARGVRVGLNASFDDKTSTFSGNTMDVYLDGGTLTGPAVWGLRPDYSLFVSQDLSVAPEGSLTIRAGTVVKFAQYAGLYVSGRLEVPGTSAEPVYLTDWRDDTVGGDANRDEGGTKPGPGWWRTLQISGAGSAALAYCTVRYAGYWDRVGMAKSGSGDLTMSHCAVTDMLGHGLQVVNSPGTTVLESSMYANNTQSGMHINASQVMATGCSFKGNGEMGVLHDINSVFDYTANAFDDNASGSAQVNGGSLTTNVTWKRGGGDEFVMVVQADMIVEEGAVLTIEPGVKVRFVRYPSLVVKGELKAVGTASAPIVFEGTTGQAGWWQGIQVVNAGSATLEWCEVAHGGYWGGVGLFKTGSGALVLKNTGVRDHNGDGLRIDNSTGQHQIDRCVFAGNHNGILVRNQSLPVPVTGSQIISNSIWGIQNEGPAEVDARHNWWGDASGPYHPAKNSDGMGNRVSDLVQFEPWSTEPVVSSPPRITVEVDASGDLVLSWPVSASGFAVESSTDLRQWENWMGGTVQMGDRIVLKVSMNDSVRFFRLRQ